MCNCCNISKAYFKSTKTVYDQSNLLRKEMTIQEGIQNVRSSTVIKNSEKDELSIFSQKENTTMASKFPDFSTPLLM